MTIIEIHWKHYNPKTQDISHQKPITFTNHYTVYKYLTQTLTIIEIHSDKPGLMFIMTPIMHSMPNVQKYDMEMHSIDILPVTIAKFDKYDVFENGKYQTRLLENGKYISCEIISIGDIK